MSLEKFTKCDLEQIKNQSNKLINYYKGVLENESLKVEKLKQIEAQLLEEYKKFHKVINYIEECKDSPYIFIGEGEI